MMEKQKNLLVFLAENARLLGKSHGQFPNGGNNKPSVPRASIIWLAHAVNVVRPASRRLHIDRARFAKGWHLGITLGVCMSG
jgi:hypothetical protein